MKVRLCPYCDSEMKKAHWCDVCHSFVWNAEKMDIHLNTQTPGAKEAQGFYEAPKTNDTEVLYEASEADDIQDSIPAPFKLPKMAQAKSWDKDVFKKQVKKAADLVHGDGLKESRDTNKAIMVGVIVFIVVIVVLAVISVGEHYSGNTQILASDSGEAADDIGLNFGDDQFEEDEAWNYVINTDLTQEEMEARTQHCTARSHMELYLQDIESVIEDYVYTLDAQTVENYSDVYGYEKSSLFDTYTSYSTEVGWRLDDDYNRSFVIDSDTATGELHSMSFRSDNEGDIAGFLRLFLEDIVGAADLEPADYEQILSAAKQEDYTNQYNYYDNYEIYLTYDGDRGIFMGEIRSSLNPYTSAQEVATEELSESDAVAAGEECNSERHMDFSHDDMRAVLEPWIQSFCPGLVSMTETYNTSEQYSQLGGHVYERTSYNRFTNWQDQENHFNGGLASDTVSGRVHHIFIKTDDLDRISQFMALIFDVIGAQADPDEFMEHMKADMERDGYAFGYCNQVEFYMSDDSDYDGGFSISVTQSY